MSTRTKKGKGGMDYDPMAGKAAFDELLPRLKALPKDQVVQATVDVQEAAIAALRVAKDIAAPAVRAKFARMPDLDMTHVDALAKLAWAAWHARTEALSASATASEAKIPLTLFESESARRERMLKVIEYHLADDPDAQKVVASIRSGTGYRDLASDLTRCATLYDQHKETIQGDKTHYQPTDLADARKGARAIIEALGADRGTSEKSWLDLQARAWTLLLASHGEVRAAAMWLFRKDGDVEERFRSLYSVGRPGQGRPKKETAEPAAEGQPA